MRKILPFFLFTLLTSTILKAQCPNDVKVNSVTTPTCGNSNGKFDVLIANHSANVEVSIDGGATFSPSGGAGTSANSITFNNLAPNLYKIVVRVAGSQTVCQSFNFALRSEYGAAYSLTQVAATGCNATGSIVLGNGVLATDSVSWLSGLTPTFVTVGSLTSNTIPNLIPGKYYVIFKSNSGNNYCYSTDTVTVGNSGTACPAAVFCGNATDPTNLFPNGTFGSGGNADGTNAQINGPALANGITQYTYQPLGAKSPEDGFYSIANNTYAGSDIGNTPFGNWYDGYDHGFAVSGTKNGYQMVVNASYDPDIVLQQTVTGICPNKKYQFSAFIRDLNTQVGQLPANLTFLVNGVGLYTTGNINAGDRNWHQVGFTFQPTGSTAVISIRNNGKGGGGNDWAIDDIYMGDCVPTVSLIPIIVDCSNPPANATAKLTDVSHFYDTYQWQVKRNDGLGFVDEGPVQTGVFDATDSYIATTPLPADLGQNPVPYSGWQYRIIVGTTPTDLTSPTCSYTSTQRLIIQNCGVTLPVKITNITANEIDNKGKIRWQVAEQLNVFGYVLEKSADGKSFAPVKLIDPIQGSVANYETDDNDLIDGINYYRVKEVDQNGAVSYSKVVTIDRNNGKANSVNVYPNPADNDLFISVPANTKIRSAVILDAIGRKVIETNDLNNTVPRIRLNRLPKGVYTIKIVTNKNETINSKFIKK